MIIAEMHTRPGVRASPHPAELICTIFLIGAWPTRKNLVKLEYLEILGRICVTAGRDESLYSKRARLRNRDDGARRVRNTVREVMQNKAD